MTGTFARLASPATDLVTLPASFESDSPALMFRSPVGSIGSEDPKVHKTLAEEIIAKTVAGFLNGQGGTLLIGVRDDPIEPVGLDADYARVNPQNADGFVNWLDTMLENALGHSGAHRVQTRIDVVDGMEVCRLDVPASSKPIWTTFNTEAVLFERRNNSTRQVPGDEIDQFIAERFGPLPQPDY